MRSKACNESSYYYDLYSTPWPHKGYEIAFYDRFIKNDAKIQNHFSDYEKITTLLASEDPGTYQEGRKLLENTTLIKDNFMELNIYFQEESLLIQNERPAITRDALFGSIGGNFNLWIGITFFTLIELFELLYDLVLLSCKKKSSIVEVKPKQTDIDKDLTQDSNHNDSIWTKTNHS